MLYMSRSESSTSFFLPQLPGSNNLTIKDRRALTFKKFPLEYRLGSSNSQRLTIGLLRYPSCFSACGQILAQGCWDIQLNVLRGYPVNNNFLCNERVLNPSPLLDEHLKEIADLTAQAFAGGEQCAIFI